MASGCKDASCWAARLSYEINDDVGVGVRAYTLTVFSGGDHYNFIVGELSGRFRRVIGRARYSIVKATNAGDTEGGLSVRIPVGWKIMDYDGWTLGLDYDRLTVLESGIGTATAHLVVAMVVLGF